MYISRDDGSCHGCELDWTDDEKRFGAGFFLAVDSPILIENLI